MTFDTKNGRDPSFETIKFHF